MGKLGKSAIGLVRGLLRSLDIEVMKRETLHSLNRQIQSKSQAKWDLAFLSAMPKYTLPELLPLLPQSTAQLRQDLLALAVCQMKRDGYFVEFGATDGVSLSNSYLLEKFFGWKGILAEPARIWHSALKSNRNAIVDTRCVWSKSGAVVDFRETDIGALSTISEFAACDGHAVERKNARIYSVETVSLNDLLGQHRAPAVMDLLSIDTEGSELEILKNFDFSRYRFNLIVCEHNFTPARDDILNLLSSVGYRRILAGISGWDDWYVGEHLGGFAEEVSS
jgi:FkbM family methyltransferase